MQYFITGASGFIGKRLVRKLLEREGSIVYFLTRETGAEALAQLHEFWGCDVSRAIPVAGVASLPQNSCSCASASAPVSRVRK